MLKDFKKFILRGNLVDLAVGFTVGASFSTVAKSLVNDIIMPPIAFLLGQSDFSNQFIILRNPTDQTYPTLAAAQSAGATTLNYGAFINNVFALLVVALSMFLVIKGFNRLESGIVLIAGKPEKEKANEPTSKKCPYCLTTVPYKARRCPACTSELKVKK